MILLLFRSLVGAECLAAARAEELARPVGRLAGAFAPGLIEHRVLECRHPGQQLLVAPQGRDDDGLLQLGRRVGVAEREQARILNRPDLHQHVHESVLGSRAVVWCTMTRESRLHSSSSPRNVRISGERMNPVLIWCRCRIPAGVRSSHRACQYSPVSRLRKVWPVAPMRVAWTTSTDRSVSGNWARRT